jgi:hypothetical protein
MTQFDGPANVFFPLDGASEHSTKASRNLFLYLNGRALLKWNSLKLRTAAVMKILEDSIKHTV